MVWSPCVRCSQYALGADGDDNQKCESLLEPGPLESYCKLVFLWSFQSTVMIQDPASDVGNGSVVGCLTAQANAGGNEQLWTGNL